VAACIGIESKENIKDAAREVRRWVKHTKKELARVEQLKKAKEKCIDMFEKES